MLKEFSKGVVREMAILLSIMSGVRRERIGEKAVKFVSLLMKMMKGLVLHVSNTREDPGWCLWRVIFPLSPAGTGT